ncbi:MAG TPA: YciI family protein [Jatrophihabitans sp.]|jgi:hypothetical protein|uniref:YciI family protein n=1 Tax=Jatrophihabitans sp. TaxID=1932789 RepID=UPI002DFA6CF1|nr:YciI family protein [Jatrophihabitans sp.]
MKYLILISANPEGAARFAAMEHDERYAMTAGYRELDAELARTGEKITSASLQGPDAGVRLSVADGKVVATDGPFAETKEFLAGFYFVECDGIERAIELASRMPEVEWGSVEIRPVRDLSGLGL